MRNSVVSEPPKSFPPIQKAHLIIADERVWQEERDKVREGESEKERENGREAESKRTEKCV